MKTKSRPSNLQIVIFFIGFVLLFFLVFALGVIVGKGLNDSDTVKVDLNERFENEVVGGPDGGVVGERKLDEYKLENSSQNETRKEVQVEGQPADNSGNVEIEREKTLELSKDDDTNIQKQKELQKSENEKELNADSKEKQDSGRNENLNTSTNEEKKDTKEQVAKLVTGTANDLPATDPGGKFTVQLGSFKNAQNAFDFEKKFNAKGYPSFVEKIDILGKGTWYRVRVGSFNTKEKAKSYAEKIKVREKLDFSQVAINQ